MQTVAAWGPVCRVVDRPRENFRRRPPSAAFCDGGTAVLIASDLSKDMVGNPLLRGVSFKFERKDRLAIAGRNGAGKTTLLRMLARENVR